LLRKNGIGGLFAFTVLRLFSLNLPISRADLIENATLHFALKMQNVLYIALRITMLATT
jgi:hypothetical protein